MSILIEKIENIDSYRKWSKISISIEISKNLNCFFFENFYSNRKFLKISILIENVQKFLSL